MIDADPHLTGVRQEHLLIIDGEADIVKLCVTADCGACAGGDETHFTMLLKNECDCIGVGEKRSVFVDIRDERGKEISEDRHQIL